ncbi:uncharacterized protein LOC128071095 [Budorcas taxicolor]|uniref:uncharacterized protein LOC128071095 n=1 Tax=Budorcas taxicolor TaxID=37181 RepID=UPI002284D9E9|nr:uncharacterized protein LOC128071095 [Budorcas taxicolor]
MFAEKIDNYNLCVSSLKSDPRSLNADTKGLGHIMFEISLAKAKDNLSQVQILLQGVTDPDLKRLLNECLDEYNSIVGNVMDGSKNVDLNAFNSTADKVERAYNEVQTCEESFGEVRRRSPLTDRNKLFTSEIAVVGYIVFSYKKIILKFSSFMFQDPLQMGTCSYPSN